MSTNVNFILELNTTNLTRKCIITCSFAVFSFHVFFSCKKTQRYNIGMLWLNVYKLWQECDLTIFVFLWEIFFMWTCTSNLHVKCINIGARKNEWYINAWACEVHEHLGIEYNQSWVMTNESKDMWECEVTSEMHGHLRNLC